MAAPPHEEGEGDASISGGSRAPPSRPLTPATTGQRGSYGRHGLHLPAARGDAAPVRCCGVARSSGDPSYWLAAPLRGGRRSSMAAGTPPHEGGERSGTGVLREGNTGEEKCGPPWRGRNTWRGAVWACRRQG